jgi:hypothetical protein
MRKVDLKKELKHLYGPSRKEISIVDVPPMQFLMVDGAGNPNTSADYADAIEALFAVAYAIKFRIKRSARNVDYGVMPLEGLWWARHPDQFITRNKDAWQWTMMIMQPEFVTTEDLVKARQTAEKKDLAALNKIRFERYHEGRAAQILHTGSYDAEASTIASMHAFISQHGYVLRGKHHEIYLNDARKTAPERLKTVLRQPFQAR